MKKTAVAFLMAVAAFVIIINFTSCLKDTCTRTYTYTIYEPVYKTVQEVRDNIKSNTPREIEKPGKLFIRGNYIFLNEINKGIHIINNSNPASPQRVAFIDVPGNIDIAVKGNILYADLYTDLVTIDISNPLSAAVKKITEGVFPHRFYSSDFATEQNKIITGWKTRDTTITERCTKDLEVWTSRGGMLMMAAGDMSNKANSGVPGISGSMARFTIVNDYLYTVGYSELSSFNISNPLSPSLVKKNDIGWNIETIYPFKDKLFIGSSSGIFIYSVANPSSPGKLGQFSHVRSCDPVIADDNYAYVTLRSGTICEGFTNQLEVLNVANPLSPSLVKTYSMTNPHGLSKDGNLLFICDGDDGVKVYDAADVTALRLKNTIQLKGTYDVIAFNKKAIIVTNDGLYQYDCTDVNNIKLLSRMGLKF